MTLTYDVVAGGDITGRIWEITLDGAPLCEFTGTVFNGTGWWGWCSWTVTAGESSFEARLAPDDSFFETEELNDTTSLDLSVTHGNLSISDTVLRSAPDNGGTVLTDPQAGETVYVTVTYDVDAPGALDGRIVEIWLNGAELCGLDFQVSPGTDRWAWCSWVAEAGDHSFLAVLDPDNQFLEDNEDDNVDHLVTGNMVFADGFELGSSLAWTSTTPQRGPATA